MKLIASLCRFSPLRRPMLVAVSLLATGLSLHPTAADANGAPPDRGATPRPSSPTSPPGSSATGSPPATAQAASLRPQKVVPLKGVLDRVPMINDNNPELIREAGILFSSFNGRGRGVPSAHLDQPLTGRFDLFSHHVYAGTPETLDSTLWIAVVAAPRGQRPVTLSLLEGATALSQSLDPSQPAAPFVPLPELMPQGANAVFAGPGSRVATELLRGESSALLPRRWTLPKGKLSTLVVLPLPVRGLDPLLNGRNLQMRLRSDGPVDVATLAAFGPLDRPPPESVWADLLDGPLSPREHAPTPRGSTGKIVYSRVSGIQRGATWRATLTDPGAAVLSVRNAPISWPISSLAGGTLGTNQVQTAELDVFYPGTAWAAHGNYGVEYDLTIPLRNDTRTPVTLALAIESPIKGDRAEGGLRFRTPPSNAVVFRGTVQVSGLDGPDGRPQGRQGFHLVQRAGQIGPRIGTVSLAPGQERQVRVRLIYPADATPPQVLSLLPTEAVAPGGAVKQSETSPAARP
jgi:hypothetical protein